MPRVKIESDKCTSKEVTTRSKTKIECKNKSPRLVVLKRSKSRPMSQPKTMALKKKPKKDIDEGTDKDRSNENLRQNKDSLKPAKNQMKKASGDNSKKVEQKPYKNKFIILDDVSKGSEDDSKYESEDDYEPDTEDEEEYRSRSYFW